MLPYPTVSDRSINFNVKPDFCFFTSKLLEKTKCKVSLFILCINLAPCKRKIRKYRSHLALVLEIKILVCTKSMNLSNFFI